MSDWSQICKEGRNLEPWSVDFTRDVRPIPCHSHNDYVRPLPLYSALSAGCISVEADVWLVDGELYVGHYERSLTRNRTLSSLYINPLLEILERQNSASEPMFEKSSNITSGVFGSDRDQSLTLLIDFKNYPSETWIAVRTALEPLRSRGYLSFWNGEEVVRRPITVVGTGDAPFDRVQSDEHNPHHDIFFDAPLDQMQDADSAKEYSLQNSYYASVSFGKTIGRLWTFDMTAKQLSTLRGQVRGAHVRGLKVRYWNLPDWPISLRNHIWGLLVREGVDILNVDDLKAATTMTWH